MDIINSRWKQPEHGEMSHEGQAWGVPGGGIKVSRLMMDVWARGEEEGKGKEKEVMHRHMKCF